jgi:hypothetical protein
MSLLPVVLIVILIIGAGFFLLEGDVIKLPGARDDNYIQTRRLNGFPTTINTEKDLKQSKMRKVITSKEELYSFISSIDPLNTFTLSEEPNFDKEVVLAVTSGSQTLEGNAVKIRRVYLDKKNNSILVSIKQTSVDEDCENTLGNNIPVDLVAMDKTELKIEFENQKEDAPCEQKTNESSQTTDQNAK